MGVGVLALSSLLPAVVQGQAKAPLYYFTTLAGAVSAGSANGSLADARFNGPNGISTDGAGNIFVADTDNQTVRKITPAGVVSTLAGKVGVRDGTDGVGSAARFVNPTSVTARSDGVVFVGDSYTVRRIDPNGLVTTLAGVYGQHGLTDGVGPAARFLGDVQALLLEPDGNLLVLEAQAIRRLQPDGTVKTLFRSEQLPTSSVFAGGLARDVAGNLYAACYGLNQARIVRLTPSGGVTVVADETNGLAGVSRLGGLVLDGSGNLFAADPSRFIIYKIDPTGRISVFAGTMDVRGAKDGPALEAQFASPAGLAFDPNGNLLITDSAGNTIRRITLDGRVGTLAGLALSPPVGTGDGKGAAARLGGPTGIAVTKSGVCYAACSDHTIRRIAPDGTATTVAGAANQPGYADGTGEQARFNFPRDLALDRDGNIYVIDANAAVRKLTPAGVVTTIAGKGIGPGFPVDGQGSAAAFGSLTAIAVAPDGNIWVAETSGWSPDFMQHWWARMRKITPGGTVTTEYPLLANPHTIYTGLAFDTMGTLHACDAIYDRVLKATPSGVEVIRFNQISFAPYRVAVDAAGHVFFTEGETASYCRVARLTDNGQLEILGGQRFSPGHQDGLGTDAIFSGVGGIAVDATGALYVACANGTIRKGVLASAPSLTTQPQSQSVAAGGSVVFSVAAAAVPEPAYQWQVNGTPIPGATASTLSFSNAHASDAGDYTVVITNELGTVTSAKATLTVTANSGGGGSSSGGGGGGAPSLWFFLAAGAAAAMRQARRIFASAPCEEF